MANPYKDKMKQIRKEGREDYIRDLTAWRNRMDDLQRSREKAFNIGDIKQWLIGFWDQTHTDGISYGYVEMNKIPNIICCNVLIHLLTHAKQIKEEQRLDLTIGLRFRDFSAEQPEMVGDDTLEFGLFQRWEITIQTKDREALTTLITELNNAPDFSDKAFEVNRWLFFGGLKEENHAPLPANA
ncbi:hypothetical protein [Neptuniibacter sp. QD37_11]|uniref:hypothetical protein n=1 Tax=Neptuniibacter sp. QD37_11 TaxID=3398209 RepID=UPI0039F4582A